MSIKTEMKDEEEINIGEENLSNVFVSCWVKAEFNDPDVDPDPDFDPDFDPGPKRDLKRECKKETTRECKKEKREKSKMKSERKTKKKWRPKQELKCDYCSFSTVHKNSIQQHLRSHTGERIKCEHCDYETKFSASLRRHMESKHKDLLIQQGKALPMYYCEKCTYSSTCKYLLKHHQRKHKTEKQYKCPHCPFQTAYRNGFLKHTKTHLGTGRYKCDKCTYETKFRGRIERHLETIHNQVLEAKHICEYCGSTSKERWKLRVHQQKSMSKGYIKCPICPYHTFYKCGYRKHKKTHEGDVNESLLLNIQEKAVTRKPHEGSAAIKKDESGVLNCEKCPYKTVYDNDMKTHLVEVHNVCNICGQYYSDVYNLRTHQTKSRKAETMKCQICNFESNYKCEIAVHKKTHFKTYLPKNEPLNIVEKIQQAKLNNSFSKSFNEIPNQMFPESAHHHSDNPYMRNEIGQCKFGSYIVDKSCVEWNTIQVLETGNGEKPFQCHLCDYTSKFKASVQRHFQRLHTNSNNKPYKCCNCEFATKTKDQIAGHNKKSLSEILLTCNHCSYTSYYKCSFAAHQRTHYTNICTICHNAFRQRHELSRHMETVHIGKGYQCRFCEFVAYRKDTLLSHETIHTGNKPYKCELCEYTALRNTLLIQHYVKQHNSLIPDSVKKVEKKLSEPIIKIPVSKNPLERQVISIDQIEALRVPDDEENDFVSNEFYDLGHDNDENDHDNDGNGHDNDENDHDNDGNDHDNDGNGNDNDGNDHGNDGNDHDNDGNGNDNDGNDHGNDGNGHHNDKIDNSDHYDVLADESTVSNTEEFTDKIKESNSQNEDENIEAEYLDMETASDDSEKIAEKIDDETKKIAKNKFGKFVIDTTCVDWSKIQVLMTDDSEQPFQCYLCDFRSRFRNSVKRHFQRHHTSMENRPYKCFHCEFSTKTRDSITKHNSKNKSDKTLTCDVCKYKTGYKCAFVEHTRKHYPYKCKICKFRYRLKRELTKHFAAVHLGACMKCRYCDFVASRKDSVLVHETIHTGKKPFRCDQCEFSSVRKYYLIAHLKKEHNTEYKREKKVSTKKMKKKKKEIKKFNECVEEIMEELDEVIDSE